MCVTNAGVNMVRALLLIVLLPEPQKSVEQWQLGLCLRVLGTFGVQVLFLGGLRIRNAYNHM